MQVKNLWPVAVTGLQPIQASFWVPNPDSYAFCITRAKARTGCESYAWSGGGIRGWTPRDTDSTVHAPFFPSYIQFRAKGARMFAVSKLLY